MNTQEFLELLEAHPSKELVFEYDTDTYVPKAYHITEVKNVSIESVDCGGRPDSYKQTVVQLWINDGEVKEKNMSAKKALSIFKIVDKITPMDRSTEIFFEWGHGDLRTSNYAVENVLDKDGKLVLQLFAPPTVCKPKVELELALVGGNGCGGSGCC